MAALTTPNISPLLALPRELRDKILDFAIWDLPTRLTVLPDHHISGLVIYPRALPSICFANKKVHAEGLRIWMHRTRFCLDVENNSMKLFLSFLKRTDYVKDIHMLAIRIGNRVGNETMTLIVACQQLRSLTLTIYSDDFAIAWEAWGMLDDREGSMLISELRLMSLFSLPSLRHLKLRVTIDETSFCWGIDPGAAMAQLWNGLRWARREVGKQNVLRVECCGEYEKDFE